MNVLTKFIDAIHPQRLIFVVYFVLAIMHTTFYSSTFNSRCYVDTKLFNSTRAKNSSAA